MIQQQHPLDQGRVDIEDLPRRKTRKQPVAGWLLAIDLASHAMHLQLDCKIRGSGSIEQAEEELTRARLPNRPPWPTATSSQNRGPLLQLGVGTPCHAMHLLGCVHNRCLDAREPPPRLRIPCQARWIARLELPAKRLYRWAQACRPTNPRPWQRS
ncbi:hypothetical protein TWF696_006763 [Orbilia brochopaga]|uniref:Uncharacterized protein n=1 Tax=Orbilia brochopaga TaxID=3140254 RepID=A0AAV9UPU7_9PEZI